MIQRWKKTFTEYNGEKGFFFLLKKCFLRFNFTIILSALQFYTNITHKQTLFEKLKCLTRPWWRTIFKVKYLCLLSLFKSFPTDFLGRDYFQNIKQKPFSDVIEFATPGQINFMHERCVGRTQGEADYMHFGFVMYFNLK